MRLGDCALVLYFKKYFHTLNSLKSPLFLCLAFVACVTLPGQTLELYRYTAQAFAESYASIGSTHSHFGDPQGLIGFIVLATSVLIVSFVFLSVAAHAHRTAVSDELDDSDGQFTPGPFLTIACTPALAVGAGLVLASADFRVENIKEVMLAGARLSIAKDFSAPVRIEQLSQSYVEAQLQVNWWLHFMAAVCVAIGALVFLLSRPYLRKLRVSAERTKTRCVYLIGFGLPIVLTAAFVLSPVWLARTLSSFGVLCLFFAAASVLLRAVSLLEIQVRMPLMFLALVCAAIFGIFGLNDNHAVRAVRSPETSQSSRSPPGTIADGFAQWLKERRDRPLYDVYPVYVVATEGGGIYAAYRTATLLASLQDRCPRFSHHVFAISSVSGGSVGAAIFNGLTRKIRQSDDRFKAGSGCRKPGDNVGGQFFADVSEDILRDDYLSPVLGAFLFPDFLQRFLFFPVPQFDRSIALEKSLEESWQSGVKYYQTRFKEQWVDEGNPLSASFSTSWSPRLEAPALLINTTEVASGRGRVISPFSIDTDEFRSFPWFASGDASRPSVDISLSTAAVLSARFPWLTPPGSFSIDVAGSKKSSRQNIQLVDGGYFDNSGVTMALAAMREIEGAIANLDPAQKIQINLIVLTSADFGDPSGTHSDYLAPVQTLLSTRSARGGIAVKEAERVFAAEKLQASPFHSLGKAELLGYGYPLPLGWRLSPITRLLILGQSDGGASCRQNVGDKRCFLASVVEELNK